MMQPLYSRASIEQMYSTMHDCVARMVDRIETHNSAGDTIDMHRVQMEVTLDVVSRCMFSVGIADLGDAADPRSVEHALNFAFDRLQNPLSPPLAWPTPTNKRFRRIMDEFDDVVYRLIADRRASDRNHGDMLDMLIDARDEETGEALDDREIRDEVMTTFAAGHESTAQTLTWAMYLLSKNPDVVDRLRDEVDSVLDGRLPTAADLKNLRYTAGVAAEALRLFPSAPAHSAAGCAGLHAGRSPAPRRQSRSGLPVQHRPRSTALGRSGGVPAGPIRIRQADRGGRPQGVCAVRCRTAHLHREALCDRRIADDPRGFVPALRIPARSSSRSPHAGLDHSSSPPIRHGHDLSPAHGPARRSAPHGEVGVVRRFFDTLVRSRWGGIVLAWLGVCGVSAVFALSSNDHLSGGDGTSRDPIRRSPPRR